MAVPGEPHKLFASLAGSWTTTTKEWMEPGKPPTEATGPGRRSECWLHAKDRIPAGLEVPLEREALAASEEA